MNHGRRIAYGRSKRSIGNATELLNLDDRQHARRARIRPCMCAKGSVGVEREAVAPRARRGNAAVAAYDFMLSVRYALSAANEKLNWSRFRRQVARAPDGLRELCMLSKDGQLGTKR